MADTLWILALPSFHSLWLFSMSKLSSSRNRSLQSWVSQDLVRPGTTRLLMNAPIAGWMTCAMYGMWFLNAGHSISEASSVDSSSRVIEWLNEALSVIISHNRPSVNSKRSSTSFKCTTSPAAVCWLFSFHTELANKTGNEQAINLIESKFYFTQCAISIHIVITGWRYRELDSWCPSINRKSNFISWRQLFLICIYGQCILPPAYAAKGLSSRQQ